MRPPAPHFTSIFAVSDHMCALQYLINITAAGGGGSGVVYIETSGPPSRHPRIPQISGSHKPQDLPGSKTITGLPEHPRTPRPSQGPQDPGSPGPKSARQAAHSELLAEGVTRPAGLLWDHFVPPVLHRVPLIWGHRWRSMAQGPKWPSGETSLARPALHRIPLI